LRFGSHKRSCNLNWDCYLLPDVKYKPRPKPLSDSELLLYSAEHQTLVAELNEAVRELSALIRGMCLLLASHERENRTNSSLRRGSC
jgi:hypothetical protein